MKKILTITNTYEAYSYFIGKKDVEPEKIKLVKIRGIIFGTTIKKYHVPQYEMGRTEMIERKDLEIEIPTAFDFSIPVSLYTLQNHVDIEVVDSPLPNKRRKNRR